MVYTKEYKQKIIDRVTELKLARKTLNQTFEIMSQEGFQRANGQPITKAVVFSFIYHRSNKKIKTISATMSQQQQQEGTVLAILNDRKIADTKKVILLRNYFS